VGSARHSLCSNSLNEKSTFGSVGILTVKMDKTVCCDTEYLLPANFIYFIERTDTGNPHTGCLWQSSFCVHKDKLIYLRSFLSCLIVSRYGLVKFLLLLQVSGMIHNKSILFALGFVVLPLFR